MTAPFNPLAGNFTTTGWIADTGDYNLKIVKVSYSMVGQENPKAILKFSVAIADGPFVNKRPSEITVWEPETDFSQAGRVIMAALGYNPGRDDARFASENADKDFTLDSSNPEAMVMGEDYLQLENCVFTSTLTQNESKKNGQIYQNYKNIRPLE